MDESSQATDIEQTLTGLGADRVHGLSTREARARQQQYGLNKIEAKEKTGWQRLLARFWGPIPWMIEIAGILSAAVQRWEDFAIILVMLLVNAFVDFYQESKALNAIEVLKNKLALKTLVRRDGQWQELDAAELVPGDIIKLKLGNVVPADVRLVGEGDFLQVDQAALTGESLPVDKEPGDEAYANTVIKQGEMVAVARTHRPDARHRRQHRGRARAQGGKQRGVPAAGAPHLPGPGEDPQG